VRVNLAELPALFRVKLPDEDEEEGEEEGEEENEEEVRLESRKQWNNGDNMVDITENMENGPNKVKIDIRRGASKHVSKRVNTKNDQDNELMLDESCNEDDFESCPEDYEDDKFQSCLEDNYQRQARDLTQHDDGFNGLNQNTEKRGFLHAPTPTPGLISDPQEWHALKFNQQARATQKSRRNRSSSCTRTREINGRNGRGGSRLDTLAGDLIPHRRRKNKYCRSDSSGSLRSQRRNSNYNSSGNLLKNSQCKNSQCNNSSNSKTRNFATHSGKASTIYRRDGSQKPLLERPPANNPNIPNYPNYIKTNLKTRASVAGRASGGPTHRNLNKLQKRAKRVEKMNEKLNEKMVHQRRMIQNLLLQNSLLQETALQQEAATANLGSGDNVGAKAGAERKEGH